MPTTFPLVRVVGMHFRGQHAKDYAAALQPGDTLLLEREPDNQYDSYAIKVMTPGDDSWHLGYIEKGTAMWIATKMDEGMKFSVTVRDLMLDKNNVYPRVDVVEIGKGDARFHTHAQDEADGF